MKATRSRVHIYDRCIRLRYRQGNSAGRTDPPRREKARLHAGHGHRIAVSEHLHRIVALQAGPGLIGAISYDEAGRPLTTTYANGAATTRSYAPERGWLTRLVTALGGTNLIALSYGRDDAGRLTSVASGAGAADSWSYGYTDLDFLTQATNAGDASLSQSFTYDTAGNLLTNSQVGTDSNPAMGWAWPHTPLTVNGQSYSYDANGNLLTGGRSYAWDGENRPVTITTSTGALTAYTYGSDGARLKKSAKTSTMPRPG